MMIPQYYEFSCPVKILSGFKALSNLPYEMDLLGTRKALIVTDQGVVGAGLIKLVESVFEGSQCEIGAVFDRTPPDSSTLIVQEVARLFLDEGCDCFVAVGGGSSMDTAKCANMMVTEGSDDLMNLQGVERLKKPVKPFIAVPTTAGTGSEVTVAAVIYDENTKVKMGFTSYRLLPNVAILDPKMTVTMPPIVQTAKSTRPSPKMKRGFQLRNLSACIVAPTETPKKMVTMFIRDPWAESVNLATTPLSFMRFPSINIPRRGMTEGTNSAMIPAVIRGKRIFSCLETTRSCRIRIRLSLSLVINFIRGGCMRGTIAMYE